MKSLLFPITVLRLFGASPEDEQPILPEVIDQAIIAEAPQSVLTAQGFYDLKQEELSKAESEEEAHLESLIERQQELKEIAEREEAERVAQEEARVQAEKEKQLRAKEERKQKEREEAIKVASEQEEVEKAQIVTTSEVVEEVIEEVVDKTEPVAPVESTQSILLAQLVESEARGESYEGKVAVAEVVLNRVQSGKFPNSLSGVVHQPGQFQVVSNGSIHNTPTQESINASNQALSGSNYAQGALFFYNPRTATNRWLDTLNTVTVIGNHTFKNY